MGKRSDFERKENDWYPTPYEAVEPLFPFLRPHTKYVEPCAGDGRLISHLLKNGHECIYACDIAPLAEGIIQRDVLFFDQLDPCEMIITNPPWDRPALHAMIERFTEAANQVWLLFDADWMHTVQAIPYRVLCQEIVSIGRVSWEGNGVSGMDNCCWYRFSRYGEPGTKFNFRGG
jgi:hypothetical protein